jgi:hypothetical protein
MNEEARLLLSALRPNGQDANDPALAAALEAAKNDPALAQWLAEQQEFDRAVAERLRAVPVPADLKAKILAGAAVSRRRAWWSQPRALAIAAMLAVFFAIGGFWMGRPAGLAEWQKNGLAVLNGIVAGERNFDMKNGDPKQLTAWLASRSMPVPGTMPTTLDGKPSLGCKTINWDGHKMSLICFDLGGGESVHLFVTNRAGLAGVPPDGPKPQIVQTTVEGKPWTVALWNEGDKTLMLASQQGEAPLRRVLQIALLSPVPTLAITR